MNGVVVPLRPAPDCRDCENALFGGQGTFCILFNELIVTESTTAPQCDSFERVT